MNDPEKGPRGQHPGPDVVTVPENVPTMAELVIVAVPLAVPAHGGESMRENVAEFPEIVPVTVSPPRTAVKEQPDCATATGWLETEAPQEFEKAALYEPATFVQEEGSEGELDPPPQPRMATTVANKASLRIEL